MTFPIQPLPKLPNKATPTDKDILAPKITELIGGANTLNQQLAALASRIEKLESPTPIPEPEPIPEPTPEPTPTPEPEPVPVPQPVPEPTPTPPPTGSVVEFPRVTPLYAGPTPARIINVPSGGDLYAALQTARGENVEIRLEPGGTYVGHFGAMSSGDGWITVKGMNVPPGTRVRPSTAAAMPKLISINTDPTLRARGRQWWFEGVEVAVAASITALTYDIVDLDAAAADIVLAGVFVHGQTRSEVKRGILLNCGAAVIRDSWISDCHAHGQEGHGIGGWRSTGPQLIENNYVEAAGINIMIGGATPLVAGVRTADVTIRRNHLIKPLAWKGDWTAKNLLETKNVNRALIEDNVLENSWTSAQVGIGVVFKSANDQGDCNWCQSSDITFRRSLIRNVEQAIQVNAAENYSDPNNAPPPLSRVLLQDLVFDDVGSAGGAKAVQLTSGHSKVGCEDVTFERTVIAQGAGKIVSGMLMVGPFVGAKRAAFRDNEWTHATYPLLTGEGAMGIAALTIGAPDAEWRNMVLVKSPNHTDGTPALPPGTRVVTAETELAMAIRATVASATAGVVVAP